ncbi:MAG: tryptophan synthase subunit alpha [Phycisphaerales bacterium]
MTIPGAALSRSIRAQREALRGPALIPYLTAGFPSPGAFRAALDAIAPHAAAIEIGVPFTDPMADGVTLQRTSRAALEQGVTLRWVLDEVGAASSRIAAPIALMGYLNPFLRFGLADLAAACSQSGVHALIVPDLPLEEAAAVRAALHERGVGLVQLVSPVTDPSRAARIAAATDGFLYAVTATGVTGGSAPGAPALDYLRRVRGLSAAPVCAGFGVRSAADVAALGAEADGVIVGSALAEAIERGADPGEWLAHLRASPA